MKLSRSISSSLWRMKDSVTFTSGVFFFQAEDGIRDLTVTGVQTCALPIYRHSDVVYVCSNVQCLVGIEGDRKCSIDPVPEILDLDLDYAAHVRPVCPSV